jgi:acyl carrier protein
MTTNEVRAAVLRALGNVAPEADLSGLDPAQPIRDQLDIDSMDFMNFLLEIDRDLHVDVPETDYARVATLDQCVAYLSERVAH